MKRKFNPNPNQNSQNNIRNASIRHIIGDRRFKATYSSANSHENDGSKRVKRVKVGDPEADDLPKSGGNASSVQCEVEEAPRDSAAKTAEYAFFKRMKENTCSNIHVHPKYHEDNQSNNVQPSDHLTKVISNVHKENSKYDRSSLPVAKEGDDAHCSFLSTPCDGPKTGVHNAVGVTCTEKVKPGEYSWMSPPRDNRSKTPGNKGVFSAKREKLRQWVAKTSDVNELYSKGHDLVSVLLSRILPENTENDCHKDPMPCQVETDSKHELPSFSEFESATLINSHRSKTRKLIESDCISYLDGDFCRSTSRFKDTNLLEWDPLDSEYSSVTQAAKSNIRHHYNTIDDFRIPRFSIGSSSSFNEPLPTYEPSTIEEFDVYHVHNQQKLIEWPRTLLLGWEDNSKKDEDLHNMLLSSSPPSPITCPNSPLLPHYNCDSFITPRMGIHLEEKTYLDALPLPYTHFSPKRLMPIEDCSNDNIIEDCRIKLYPRNDNWYLGESLNEKKHSGMESFLFLIGWPDNNILRNRNLHSFFLEDNEDDDFVHSPDNFSEVNLDPLDNNHFVSLGCPFLLHDSNKDDDMNELNDDWYDDE